MAFSNVKSVKMFLREHFQLYTKGLSRKVLINTFKVYDSNVFESKSFAVYHNVTLGLQNKI